MIASSGGSALVVLGSGSVGDDTVEGGRLGARFADADRRGHVEARVAHLAQVEAVELRLAEFDQGAVRRRGVGVGHRPRGRGRSGARVPSARANIFSVVRLSRPRIQPRAKPSRRAGIGAATGRPRVSAALAAADQRAVAEDGEPLIPPRPPRRTRAEPGGGRTAEAERRVRLGRDLERAARACARRSASSRARARRGRPRRSPRPRARRVPRGRRASLRAAAPAAADGEGVDLALGR